MRVLDRPIKPRYKITGKVRPARTSEISGAAHEDLAPKQEVAGRSENAIAEANRITRDSAAFRKVEDINKERRAEGPRIAAGVYFYKADRRVKSRYFFSLGTECRKRFLQRYPQADVSAISINIF